MRTRIILAALLACAASARAQQPAKPPAPARPDSTQRADSIEKARQDSIALVKELEGAQQPAASGSSSGTQQVGGSSGPTNPRMLPDFSAVGDLLGDLSPRGSTQEDRTRLGVREVEI